MNKQAVAPPPPFLTDEEIKSMCQPLTQPAAQRRFLERQGMLVAVKPNGRPLMLRSELDRVLGAGRFALATSAGYTVPNLTALREHLNRKRGQHGAQA